MIKGIGLDIVSIGFIEEMMAKCGDIFMEQYFSRDERELFIHKKRHAFDFLAGRFAAKEALLKAIGTGMECEMKWNEIEFLNQSTGQPYLVRNASLQNYVQQQETVLVTISHHCDYAAAFIIIEGNQSLRGGNNT